MTNIRLSRFLRPSPAMVVAAIALLASTAGVSYAALEVTGATVKDASLTGRDVRNGTVASKDVKDRSLLARDFKRGQLRAGPTGPQGPAGQQGPAGAAGAQGPQGPIGPSTGYGTSFETPVGLPENGTPVDLMTLGVPEGSYVVVARLQGLTLVDPDGAPASNYRYDCYLTAGGMTILDDPVARVGTTAGVESHLSYNGTFSGSGPIKLRCNAGNGHPLAASNGSLVAIKVGGLG
jgi:hypothetical protein